MWDLGHFWNILGQAFEHFQQGTPSHYCHYFILLGALLAIACHCLPLLVAVCQANIQLPLEVYKLWTLPGFSETLSEKQKLCEVAPTAFLAQGEFQPDLEYLKVMAGPETLIRPGIWRGSGMGMMMG